MNSSKYRGTQILVLRNCIFHGVSKTCCDSAGDPRLGHDTVSFDLGGRKQLGRHCMVLLNREKPKRIWGSLQTHIVELNVSCSEIGHSWWHPQYPWFKYSLCMFIALDITKTIQVGMNIWSIEPSTSSVQMDLCSFGPFVQHHLKQKSDQQWVCRVETISVFRDST